jgi:predicted house-cleaning noncanonical NTP pyrophosphatase (MazG superfamily)
MKAKNEEELADIIEVVEALKKLPEFVNVEEIRIKKLKERGGFEKKIIIKGEK